MCEKGRNKKLKKPMRFLAWVLAASMVTTAIPATATPIFASEGTQEVTQLATPTNPEEVCEGFGLSCVNSWSLSLMKGETGKFEVKPNFGNNVTKPVSYQWSYRDDDLGKYVDIPGANTASLDVTGLGYDVEYRVYAVDTCGHHAEKYFKLYHKSGIELSSQKRNYNVTYGESVTMTVNATDKTSGASIVSYQWYKGNGVKIKSATSNKYTVTATDSQSYYCVVKDSIGDEKEIYFKVNPTAGLKVEVDKTSYNVVSGGSQTLSVNATTELEGAALSYQWSAYNKTTHKWDDIAGANANTYVASGITANTKVKCMVTASYNDLEQNISETFILNVTKYGLNVTSNVYNGYGTPFVKVGTPVTFKATAGAGTIVAEYYDRSTFGTKQLAQGADNTFTFTPMVSGETYFRVYINEDRNEKGYINQESKDRYYKSLCAFDAIGTITIGQATTITPPSENGKYVGYEFTTTQTGEYSIITYDQSKELYLACEDGYTREFTTNKENSNDTVFKNTVNLEANKKYYIVDESQGYWSYDENDNGKWVSTATPYALAITNDIKCDHSNTKVKNAVAATCTTAGYSGDIYCKDCDVLVAAGTALPVLGHTASVVNKKAATLKADGYTGDTVCSVCGATISTGTKISKIKSVTLSKSVLTYTGKKLKAKVVVKDSKGKKISSANYKVTYSKNIKSIGVKTVKVTFKGNYSGTKTLKYRIAPKNTSKLTVKAGKKSINVRWKKQASQTTGYQIQYSTKKNFKGAKTITVKKNSTTKTTIKSLKKGTTYYVRIRTYKTVNKKAVASNWSSAKKVKVKK